VTVQVSTDGTDAAESSGEVASQGRSGRNLPAAIAVGVGLGVVVVASLLWWNPAFIGLVVLVIPLAVWELATVLASRGIVVPLVPGLVGAVLIIIGAYVGGPGVHALATALTIVAMVVWRLGDRAPGYLRDVAGGAFVVIYVPFLAGYSALLLREPDGSLWVTTLFLVVVASDLGGYIVGALLGRHPMAPTVSPKKSWEGFGGSLVLGIGTAVAAVVFLLDAGWWIGVVLGVAGVLSATLGDLAESALKRDLNVKDMSNLLPGHGGVMDRLDSLLPSAVVTWLVLTALLPIGG